MTPVRGTRKRGKPSVTPKPTRKQVGKAKGPSPEARPKRPKRPKPEVAPDQADTEAADLAAAITRGDADALERLDELSQAQDDPAAKAKHERLIEFIKKRDAANPSGRDAAEDTETARKRNAELAALHDGYRARGATLQPHVLPLARLEAFRRARANRRREPGRTAATFEELRVEVEKARADLAKYKGRPTPPPLDAEELVRLRRLHDAMRDARTRPDDAVPGEHRIPDEIALDVLDPLERALSQHAAMPEAREVLEHVAAAVYRLLGYSNLLERDDLKELSTARPKAELALLYGSALMGLGVGRNAAVRILARDLGMNERTADKALAE